VKDRWSLPVPEGRRPHWQARPRRGKGRRLPRRCPA